MLDENDIKAAKPTKQQEPQRYFSFLEGAFCFLSWFHFLIDDITGTFGKTLRIWLA
jgi:hypothetical protein